MAKQTRCGVPWPVCPDCLGEGLFASAGEAWCRRCLRRWKTSEVDPCPWPAAELLSDGSTTSRVCASHAAHASAAKLRPQQVGALRVLPGGRPGASPSGQRRRDGAPEAYDPDAPSTEDYLDCAGRLRTFRLQAIAGGLFLEAVELRSGEAAGLRFIKATPADGMPPWGELRALIRERLARRDIVQTPERLELLGDTVRGQLSEALDAPEAPPTVLVDDLELRWEELGQLLRPFIGFGLRLEVCEPGEE